MNHQSRGNQNRRQTSVTTSTSEAEWRRMVQGAHRAIFSSVIFGEMGLASCPRRKPLDSATITLLSKRISYQTCWHYPRGNRIGPNGKHPHEEGDAINNDVRWEGSVQVIRAHQLFPTARAHRGVYKVEHRIDSWKNLCRTPIKYSQCLAYCPSYTSDYYYRTSYELNWNGLPLENITN